MLAWHVLRTRPQRELAVAADLKAAGHASYVPTVLAWWRPCRYGRRRRLDTGLPVLTGYVLIAVPVADWPAVLQTDGVFGVLAMDGHPAAVADAEIEAMRRAAGKPPIAAGGKVAVETGLLAGRVLTVRSVDAPRRSITADVTLLGSRRPVTISVDMLAA